MKNVFLVWTKNQARVDSLLEDLSINLGDFKVIYRDNSTTSMFKKIT